jgi:hypothetical protein
VTTAIDVIFSRLGSRGSSTATAHEEEVPMADRIGLRMFLLVSLIASLTSCAGTTSQMPSVQVPISNVSDIAGKWAGTVRRNPATEDDWLDLTIKNDGTYEYKGFRTIGATLGSGQIIMTGGKLMSETERAQTTYTLYERDGKRTLNVVGTLKTGVTFSGWLTPAK